MPPRGRFSYCRVARSVGVTITSYGREDRPTNQPEEAVLSLTSEQLLGLRQYCKYDDEEHADRMLMVLDHISELEVALAEARAQHADVVERNTRLAALNMRLSEQLERVHQEHRMGGGGGPRGIFAVGLLLGLRVEHVERLDIVDDANERRVRAHIHLKDGRLWSTDAIMFDKNGMPLTGEMT